MLSFSQGTANYVGVKLKLSNWLDDFDIDKFAAWQDIYVYFELGRCCICERWS